MNTIIFRSLSSNISIIIRAYSTFTISIIFICPFISIIILPRGKNVIKKPREENSLRSLYFVRIHASFVHSLHYNTHEL